MLLKLLRRVAAQFLQTTGHCDRMQVPGRRGTRRRPGSRQASYASPAFTNRLLGKLVSVLCREMGDDRAAYVSGQCCCSRHEPTIFARRVARHLFRTCFRLAVEHCAQASKRLSRFRRALRSRPGTRPGSWRLQVRVRSGSPFSREKHFQRLSVAMIIPAASMTARSCFRYRSPAMAAISSSLARSGFGLFEVGDVAEYGVDRHHAPFVIPETIRAGTDVDHGAVLSLDRHLAGFTAR